MSDDGALTDEEAARVFRRATELDVELERRTGGWDLAGLEAVGREVGISAEAVRRAVAEVRLGSSDRPARDPIVRVLRIVPAAPADVQRSFVAWFRSQLFETVRDRPGSAVLDRRRDPDAERRRRRDTARRYRLAAVGRATVDVAGVPGGGTAVRVDAELATTIAQRWRRGAAAVAGGWLVAATTAAGVSGTIGMEHVWLLTPPATAGGGWWAWRNAGRTSRVTAAAVAQALEGALDTFER